MLSGSIASGAVLGAPDLVVLTLTEFAQQAQRITRASDISLMVDADHGYGNALNVMRTVEEMEQAGVSALTIEDTVLPQAFGSKESLISIPEMVGKLRAGLSARQDPSLVIIGRTNTRVMTTSVELEERVRAYQDTGIDGVFLAGISSAEQLEAVRRATSLPLLLGSAPPELGGREALAAHGVRIALQGHLAFYTAAKTVYDTLKHLKEGGSPADLRDNQASDDILNVALKTDDYSRWQREYLS